MQENIINHIAFVVDCSGSIRNSGLENSMVRLIDSQVSHWANRSKELNQEVRVSIYLFNQKTECLFSDMDVNKIPSIARYYKADGDTAMIDAMLTVIGDLKETNTKYGNHSFLVYCATDGENRINNHLSSRLNREITSLSDEWTVGALVPDQDGVFECKKFGFPKNNIQIWETSKKGVEEMDRRMAKSADNYMAVRSRGFTSTKSLFNVDADLDSKVVKKNLEQLSTSEYDLLPVREDNYIKPFVETWTGRDYRVGSGYYELMKVETIQASKNVCIVDKMTGKVYMGLNARNMLKLPNYEIKVNPNNYGKFKIFVQSTSTNRKLIRGTQLLVLK